MSRLFVEEYATSALSFRGGLPAAQQPPLATQVIDYTAGAVQSAAFNAKTTFVRIHCDASCSYSFGTNPTATTSTARLPTGGTEYFGVNPGDKVSAISNA